MELVYTPEGPVLNKLSTFTNPYSFCKIRFTLTGEGPVVHDLSPNIHEFSNLPCEMMILVNGDLMTISKILYDPNNSSTIYAFAYGRLWEVSVHQGIDRDTRTNIKVSNDNELTGHMYKYKSPKSSFIHKLINLIQNAIYTFTHLFTA